MLEPAAGTRWVRLNGCTVLLAMPPIPPGRLPASATWPSTISALTGAAAYAIKAVRAANPGIPRASQTERDWQRRHLDVRIRSLVLEDQARRDALCWSVFAD